MLFIWEKEAPARPTESMAIETLLAFNGMEFRVESALKVMTTLAENDLG
jgi:hypothetical protein